MLTSYTSWIYQFIRFHIIIRFLTLLASRVMAVVVLMTLVYLHLTLTLSFVLCFSSILDNLGLGAPFYHIYNMPNIHLNVDDYISYKWGWFVSLPQILGHCSVLPTVTDHLKIRYCFLLYEI